MFDSRYRDEELEAALGDEDADETLRVINSGSIFDMKVEQSHFPVTGADFGIQLGELLGRMYSVDAEDKSEVRIDVECKELMEDKMMGLLDFEPYLRTTERLPSELVRCLNAPIVAAIDSLPPTGAADRVLILCAGDGEDLNRFSNASGGLAPQGVFDFVGAEVFNDRAARVAALMGGAVRVTQAHLDAAMASGWFEGRIYDRIICHMGLHHILRNRAGEEALVRLLENHFDPGGVFFATSVHGPSLVLNDAFGHDRDRVRVLSALPPSEDYVEGAYKVYVYGVVWLDAVLSNERLNRIMSPKFACRIMQGRYAYKNRWNYNSSAVTIPKHLKGVIGRMDAQIIKLVEVKRTRLDVPHGISHPVVEARLRSGWRRTESSVKLPRFPLNHGRVVAPVDVVYLLYSRCLYSDKSDGECARLWLINGFGYLEDAAGALFKYPTRVIGCPDLKLQVEIMPKGEILLTDVLDAGPDTPIQFAARLDYFENLYWQFSGLQFLVSLKSWVEDPDLVWAQASEGIVICPVDAPPGSFKDRLGSARYIKKFLTYDVFRDGPDGPGVYEVDDLGAIRRFRPDKVVANTDAQLAHMASAITYDEFRFLMRDPGVEGETRLLASLGQSDSVLDLGLEDLYLLLRLRYRSISKLPALNKKKFDFEGQFERLLDLGKYDDDWVRSLMRSSLVKGNSRDRILESVCFDLDD